MLLILCLLVGIQFISVNEKNDGEQTFFLSEVFDKEIEDSDPEEEELCLSQKAYEAICISGLNENWVMDASIDNANHKYTLNIRGPPYLL